MARMLGGSGSDRKPFPILEVTYSNFALVQNQWYDAFVGGTTAANAAVAAGAGSTKKLVTCFYISFEHVTDAETYEVRIIADGIDITLNQIIVAGTDYYIIKASSPNNGNEFAVTSSNAYSDYLAFAFQCTNLQVMWRKTSVVGANASHFKVCLGTTQ